MSGTRGNDSFELRSGALTLNGSAKTVTSGASAIVLSGSDGNDLFATDSPHTSGGSAVFYDGGAGSDTLDLSASAQAVAVQLQLGTRPGSSPGFILTDFALQSVHEMDPVYFDANDPEKWLVTSTGSVKTENVANIESLVARRSMTILPWSLQQAPRMAARAMIISLAGLWAMSSLAAKETTSCSGKPAPT